ncbi:MAG TPA: MarR family winged helix-turn-helix transcriptional regulator [Novosphingobium sp.]
MDNRILGDPGTPAFQVDKYPFYLLNRLVARYNAVIEDQLRAIGLDIPNWRVLMVLGELSPRGVREIAAAAVIPTSTMSRIVQRMEAAGLVTLDVSPEDARVTEVSLTRQGEAKLVEARAATAPIYAKVIRGFGKRDFDKLIAHLTLLHENLAD